jgi:hypothetical protein
MVYDCCLAGYVMGDMTTALAEIYLSFQRFQRFHIFIDVACDTLYE